jgi:hypothetical protein
MHNDELPPPPPTIKSRLAMVEVLDYDSDALVQRITADDDCTLSVGSDANFLYVRSDNPYSVATWSYPVAKVVVACYEDKL